MSSPQLLIAPAAGGKTAYTIQLALRMARSQQAQVRVCVPTSLQARAWRSRLAAAGGAIGVHVLTFDQLAAACLNEAKEAYTQLSNPVEYRLLRTVIDRQELRHYAPLKTKPGFIQVTQKLIAELKSARVMLADFATAVAQSGSEARLTELADLYTAYQTELQQEGWADRVGLHWLAAEALSERAPDACRNWPLLIVDGFDDFTAAQLTLLQLLANRVGECIVTLTQAERITFPRYQATKAAVEAALGMIARPLPEIPPQTTRHPTLRHLSRHIFAMPPGAASPHAGALLLREAPDRFTEARIALRWLKQQIVWHAIAPDQVALLARDMSAYRPFVQQIAAEFGLPIRLVDGQPLTQSPAIAALLSLLRLHLPIDDGGEANLPRRAVIAAWRSPYFSWQDGADAVTPADADALDALARQQHVIRGRAQWEAAFAAALTAAESTNFHDDEVEAQRPSPAAIVRSLHAKFAHFLAITQPPDTATSMLEFVRWLEALIGPDSDTQPHSDPTESSLRITAQARRSPATAVADIAALRTLKDILRGLVWAEEAVEQRRPITFADFYTELSGAVTAAHFQLPMRSDQPEILVADAIQARGLSFQAVALMGLSEGSFPAALSEDPFLRDADRRTLRARFGFPLKLTTQSAEREFFYEAITRAREKLLLTRPVLADNGAEWVASPYWEAVRHLVDAEPLPIASEAIVPLAETASWAEWWETAVTLPDGASLVQPRDTAVWQHIQAAAHIWHTRQQAETSVYEGDLSVLAAELADRFGPDHLWSASRLEAYKTCGFFFFLQAVMKLEPRQEPVEGLDARQLGLVYHEIFEQTAKLWAEDPRQGGDDEALRALVTAVAAPILDAAPDKQGFRETPWWSQTRQEIIDNVTRSLALLAQGEYAFYQAEAAFGSDNPPLALHDGADRLLLRGFIDRIDRRPDGRIRIIDYKSGGKTAFSPRAFAEGKKLQLPLYAQAAQETLGLGEVADGFYWHFQQAEASPFQLAAGEGGVSAAVNTAVAHAWSAVRQIRNGRFTPIPPADGCPTYCPAAGFCWHYSPKQW